MQPQLKSERHLLREQVKSISAETKVLVEQVITVLDATSPNEEVNKNGENQNNADH